jgi:Outer membrane receptor proteins, mostly Fe transport
LRLARQYFEESRNDRDFGDDWRTEREEKVEAWSLNLDLNKRLNVRHKLFYGLEAVHSVVQSEGLARNLSKGQWIDASNRYPQAHWSSFAAYLNHEWEWNEKTTSQVGMRYNQVLIDADFRDNRDFFPLPFASSSLSTGALTGSAGVVYRPSERWKLRLNLGTAFRAPNVDDIGKVFDSGDRVVVVPNPDLKPEYAYHGEGGIAFRLHSALKLELSVYYTHLAQAMVRRPFRLGGQDSLLYDGELSQVHALQNAAQARVYGLQLGLDCSIFGDFSSGEGSIGKRRGRRWGR